MSDAANQMAAYSDDRLLDGRVRLKQPREGYRAAIDPVLLAAAARVRPGERVLELGAGAGAAFLSLLARAPELSVTAIERDEALAALARENAAANGWADRVEVIAGDLSAAPKGAFEHVIFNPPFLEAARAHASGLAGRDSANIEGAAGLEAWIAAALAALAPRGRLTLIQRADRLGDLLAALKAGAGETVIYPIWPKSGRPAKRVIVTARKGLRAPLRLAAGLVLHGEDGAFTPAAQAILRDAAALDYGLD